jgi:hypothetical protein
MSNSSPIDLPVATGLTPVIALGLLLLGEPRAR